MSEQIQDFDVVIIGGGLVGLSLALALKPHVRIAIIEKESHRDLSAFHQQASTQTSLSTPGARAIALSLASVHIFERLGIWSKLLPVATPIKKIYVSERMRFGKTRFDCNDYHIPQFGYVIDSLFLVAVLQESVSQLSHVQFINDAELQSTQQAHDGQHLDIFQKNQSLKLRTQLLIAADGTQSSLRDRLGFVVTRKNYQQTAIVTHVELSHSHQNIATERFIPSGAIALLPVGTQQGTLIWTLATAEAERLLALTDQEFLNLAQLNFGYQSGKFLQCGRRAQYPLQALNVERPYMPGILLLGNAAHTLHPIAAQGFNLALRDLYDLSKRVNQAQHNSVDISQLDFLQDYQSERKADQAFMLQMTDGLLTLFKLPYATTQCVRSIGMVLVDRIPAAKTWIARRLMGLPG